MTTTYELMVLLRSPKRDKDGCYEEWHESTLIEAKNMKEAKKLAWEFAREQATEQGARISDAYAIDGDTLEYSD